MNNPDVCRSHATGVMWKFDRHRRISLRLTMLVGLFWFGAIVSRADTHYVAQAGQTPAPNYTNWVDASSNIQDAINVASASDTVLVSNGVYNTGGTNSPAGLTNYPSGTLLTNRVVIDKQITVRSANNDPTNTIIKGAWDPATNGPAAVRCVYMGSGPWLIGFMLTNGATQTTGTDDNKRGGGMWCNGDWHYLSNCIIAGNSMALDGGGTYRGKLYNCTLTGNSGYRYGGGASQSILYNCALISNRASQVGYGGGAYGSDCKLYNCTLTGNSVDYYGGGASGCTLSNCTLTGNSATEGGGAREATLYNCTLTGNSANHGGGAQRSTLYNCTLMGNLVVYYGGGAKDGKLYNCTLTGNEALNTGGGTYTCTSLNSIVYFNTPNNYISGDGFTNSCTTPAATGNGNITNDPMFVANGSGYGTNHVAGNYRLVNNSPCVNTGTNGSWTTNAVDLDGRTRIRYGAVDMGAYEAIYSGTIYGFH